MSLGGLKRSKVCISENSREIQKLQLLPAGSKKGMKSTDAKMNLTVQKEKEKEIL